ncbi:LOW QUALITY PROTEIN: uncharacterized protein LOC135475013 [Liolophura sinensis]|uniref:LOW QUALITY PROTEIN: uncharacterized protein LOC135475013 n=1 Tax=Liolophura sinensis TaxID=3198878 RepID=UPI003158B082
MASFFGKKGPSSAEVKREADIKKNITTEFSRALKTLQREHINSSDPIFSDDLANSVCNVLEAVFLHGLKGSTVKKITSYLVGWSTDAELVNFWQLAKKFTHSDVVSQLNHLGQISSEVGMCRAWVRVALNECLMESYVDAMIADTSTLVNYYKRTAYLRDPEEPDILKSYLQGLSEFQFQLSYNSSVLNLWTTAPLILSGLWEAQSTPNAIISTPNAGEALSQSSLYEDALDVAKNLEAESGSPVLCTKPPSRPRATSNEKLKKSSGHDLARISVPGPPPNSPHDTSAFSNKAAEELRKKLTMQSSSPNNSEASSSSHISCPDPSSDEKRSIGIPEEKGTDTSKTEGDEEMTVKEDDGPPVADLPLSSPPGSLATERRKSLPLEPALTNAVATAVETVPQTVPRPLTLRGVASKPERASSVKSDFDPMKAEDLLSARRQSEDVRSEPDWGQNYRTREFVVEQSHDYADSGSVGNSLGKMSGWSSSFDPGEHQPTRGTSVAVPIEQRERGQSYGTLLQNYTPTSGAVSSPTMQEVLENLGDSGQVLSAQPSSQPSSHTFQNQSSQEGSTSCSEFELISTPFASDMLYTSSKMYESQIVIFGEICNEKGLDIQNYQCKGCSRPIGLIYGNPRVCTFDGGYYCYECHENEEYYIPSRIVFNWDFRKHKVAKKNRVFLQEMEEHPLLDLEALNPKIYDHVNEMNDVKLLRQQLCYVKSYLFTCKQSVAEDLRKSVWPKEYLYDHLHIYSLSDLLQVMSGQLAQNLRKLVRFATKHIYECRLCSQKGFICEICNSPQVIYAFETDTTERCERCKAVYHGSCLAQVKNCPKCQRRMLRHSSMGEEVATPDSDYAIHPDDQL